MSKKFEGLAEAKAALSELQKLMAWKELCGKRPDLRCKHGHALSNESVVYFKNICGNVKAKCRKCCNLGVAKFASTKVGKAKKKAWGAAYFVRNRESVCKRSASWKRKNAAKCAEQKSKWEETSNGKRYLARKRFKLPGATSDEIVELFETLCKFKKEIQNAKHECKRNASGAGRRDIQTTHRQEQAGSRKRHIKGSGNDMRVNPG